MKKIILLFATMFSLAAIAQSNPGNMPELLKGKEIRIIPLPAYVKKKFYEGFYNKPNLKDTYKLVDYNFDETPIDALLGRTFTVISVNSFKDDLGIKRTSVELKDDKETIYYSYSYRPGITVHPFEVIGGLVYPDAYYDGYIKPFNTAGTTGIETEDQSHQHITFQKVSGKTARYTITVQASSDLPADGRKGLVLYLENGQELAFPKAEVHDWIAPKGYRTVVTLKPAEIELLKVNRITGYTLLDKNEKVSSEGSYYLRGAFGRLLAK